MLKLRDVLQSDGEMIYRWRSLPDVSRYMYHDQQISPQEHARWFQKMLVDPARRYWIIRCDAEDVGLVNLYNIDMPNRRCHWAFYLASPSVRGRGVGSFVEFWVLEYVFDNLEFNKLCCEVLASNHAVMEMHKSFGFVQEGYFRQHVIKEGAPVDAVALAMFREEWAVRRLEIEDRLKKRGIL